MTNPPPTDDLPPGRITRETLSQLSIPAKVRLRWRVKARPKQLTPGRHHLCDNDPDDCDALLDQARALFRPPNDPDDRRATQIALEYITTLPLSHPANQADPDEDPVALAEAAWLAERGHWDWLIWIILAGRGWGKTRTGAEDAIKFALEHPKSRQALVAATFADGRDTMVEGESGILGILPPSLLEDWNRSLGELVLTNGSRMKIFSSQQPERLRGPQHHRAWADELAAWEYLQETWDMMMFGLRLGENPQIIITTTPKPLKFIRNLLIRAQQPEGGVVVTTGSTYENAKNLARAALQELKSAYEGTRLGRQELRAEMLTDVEGALWRQSDIDDHRLQDYLVPEVFDVVSTIAIGVDPAVTSLGTSAATGIIVAAKTRGPCPFCHMATSPHALVLDDQTIKGSPFEWGTQIVKAYDDWKAGKIIPEVNQGGDLVISNLRTIRDALPIEPVHASRGKVVRAEPVAGLYQQGKVHHLGPRLADLEEELTTWDPETAEASPDRLDALVWVLTDLMVPSVVSGTVSKMKDKRGRGRR